MIAGTGVDMCDVRRIEAVMERQGARFVQRILGAAEQAVYQRHMQQPGSGRAYRYVAARFAAKEALAKALGLGMRSPMGWQACEILNNALGSPVVTWHGPLQSWLAERGLHAHISLTDERHYALAFAVLEQRHCPPSAMQLEAGWTTAAQVW